MKAELRSELRVGDRVWVKAKLIDLDQNGCLVAIPNVARLEAEKIRFALTKTEALVFVDGADLYPAQVKR